jgi:hypothetical protein
LNQEELNQIKEQIEVQLSWERSEKEPPLEFKKRWEQFTKLLKETNILLYAHTQYHQYKIEVGCETASNSCTVKAFMLGYECRKSIEEGERLAQLVSGPNS